jgi:hypothetical protein
VPEWGKEDSASGGEDSEGAASKKSRPEPSKSIKKPTHENQDNNRNSQAKGKKHMEHKPNPFGKVAKEADLKKQAEEEERQRQKEEAEKAKAARDAYFKNRKKDRAMHMKKTAKGQPVLKNMIQGMLAKLQKDT